MTKFFYLIVLGECKMVEICPFCNFISYNENILQFDDYVNYPMI